MSDQNVDSLIDSLSDELEPVKRLPHPFMRLLPLLVVSLIYMVAMIAMIGPRDDWMPKMYHEISYVFEFLLSLSLFVSAAATLAWLSVPDMRGQTWLKAVPVTLGGVFLVWAVLRIAFEWGEPLHFALKNCSLDGFIMTALPVAVLTLFTKKGATTQPIWSSCMTILSFSGLGWAGLRLTCGANTFAQSFVIHFIPFVILGVLFGLLSRRIFRW